MHILILDIHECIRSSSTFGVHVLVVCYCSSSSSSDFVLESASIKDPRNMFACLKAPSHALLVPRSNPTHSSCLGLDLPHLSSCVRALSIPFPYTIRSLHHLRINSQHVFFRYAPNSNTSHILPLSPTPTAANMHSHKVPLHDIHLAWYQHRRSE